MTEEGAIWVGLLDLEDGGPVAGVSSPVPSDHRYARVMIRTHRAPVGHVCVPTLPAETLTARVRTAAEATLAEELRQHASLDNSARDLTGSCEWVARASCPRRFATSNILGVTIVVCTRDRTED